LTPAFLLACAHAYMSFRLQLIYRRLEEYDAVIVFQKLATETNERATHFAQHAIKGDAIIVKGYFTSCVTLCKGQC
jgi:hypothetical protein